MARILVSIGYVAFGVKAANGHCSYITVKANSSSVEQVDKNIPEHSQIEE
jgi:hypothetical protein